MSAPTTFEASAVEISDAELEDAVARTIEGIGVDLNTLRQYAQRGRFDTERQRRAWFAISGLGYA